jgi:hypothetical protein
VGAEKFIIVLNYEELSRSSIVRKVILNKLHRYLCSRDPFEDSALSEFFLLAEG